MRAISQAVAIDHLLPAWAHSVVRFIERHAEAELWNLIQRIACPRHSGARSLFISGSAQGASSHTEQAEGSLLGENYV